MTEAEDGRDTGSAVERFDRVTPRELRLLILVVQDGLGYEELGIALGISRASVANAMGSLRRKLAVPRRQDLADFVRRDPQLAAVLASDARAAVPDPVAEESRRRKDILRVTIDELQSVAVRARRRAASLQALPQLAIDDRQQREEEANLAMYVAELVEATLALAISASRGAQSERPTAT